MANICVNGLWHQGTVISACLADAGHRVCGIDITPGLVESLNAGEPMVYEPGLKAIVRRNMKAGRLNFTTDYERALAKAKFAYIAFDTPMGADDAPDLGCLFTSAREIGRAMAGRLTLIVTAQVPVGTCERLAAAVREANSSAAFDVVYVPEFLRLGQAVKTFRRPDRLVVGADVPAARRQVAALYRALGCPVVMTDLRTAEMAKHASNAFLATSISFINEIANLCDKTGADVVQVAEILKLDRRIGKHAFLGAGLGFAGGTLGRDVRALQKLGREHGCDSPFMDAVMSVNGTRPRLVGEHLKRIHGSLKGLRVGVLGLTYKAGTSTLRRSLGLEIVRDLVAHGVSIKVFDPLARLDEVTDLPPFEISPDPYEVARGSDALVLVTEWADIGGLDLSRLRKAMRSPVMVDTRNFFDPAHLVEKGFTYCGVGRGTSRKGN